MGPQGGPGGPEGVRMGPYRTIASPPTTVSSSPQTSTPIRTRQLFPKTQTPLSTTSVNFRRKFDISETLLGTHAQSVGCPQVHTDPIWMVMDNRGYQKRPPRPISIFPVFLFFRVNSSDQLQAGPQPKSFRGGQGVHILLDRYKRDMATWRHCAALGRAKRQHNPNEVLHASKY